MNIRTNLTAKELEHISKGLHQLANQERLGEFQPENPAEVELLNKIENSFDLAMNHLQEEFASILLDKDRL